MKAWEVLGKAENEEHAANERDLPGFYARNPKRVIERIAGGYQYGFEIGGYGFIVGWCKLHRPHKTRLGAVACGKRFEDGRPPRVIDRARLWLRGKLS